MTLAESKDLVNWKLIGHVWRQLGWDPKYNWDRMDGYRHGVWAGDLAYHDNKWYCYFIDFSSGLYVSTADRVTGPWSDPICMLKKAEWTDPAVFWDEEERQAYLVCNFGRDESVTKERVNQTRLYRMSWDGLKLLDEGQPIYRAPGAEAAKIYKINGTYYIFLAEWRENDRKQIVLRGKSLYGPLQRRVVMERTSSEHRSVCQGALVQAADKSWWFTHQLVQQRDVSKEDIAGPQTGHSYEGRSQWLIPVKWKDGWPVLGEDPDGNGIGNTVLYSRKPIDGENITAPQADDEFDRAKLGPQWQWNHNPRNDQWSLTERSGWLRLTAGVPVGEGGFWNAANTISQRLMGKGTGTVKTKVDISGMRTGQKAGFCHHSNQFILLGIRKKEDGTKVLFFDHDGAEITGPTVSADIIYYRSDIDGSTATVSYKGRWRSYRHRLVSL
jgi:beta-xylosidase